VLCKQGGVGLQSEQQALTQVAVIRAAKGGLVEQVRVGDCVELLAAAAARTRATADKHANSPLFYQLLRAHGDLGADAPAAIEMFSGRGQPSCEQLIDRYRIASRPVRDVLVDYLLERQPSVDFSSLQRLAYLLGKLFWADLEAQHPGIDSLQLPRDVAAAWKQRVLTRTRTRTVEAPIIGPPWRLRAEPSLSRGSSSNAPYRNGIGHYNHANNKLMRPEASPDRTGHAVGRSDRTCGRNVRRS
jgi:hypothetical protein